MIHELRIRSNEFVRNMAEWVELAVMDNEGQMLDLNRRQMLSGRMSDGKPIRPLYSKAYAKRKGFTTPDLYLKGDFQGDMALAVTGDQYEITSVDFKTPFLVARYGDGIFGIEDKKKAQELNDKRFLELYKEWLKL